MKRYIYIILLVLLSITSPLYAQTPSGGYVSPAQGGSGGGTTSVGPVINVTNPTYAGCSATPITDYTTCLTSVMTASNAAAKVSVGTPTVRSSCAVPMQSSAQTSLTTAAAGSTCSGGFSITAGDTTLVGVLAQSPVSLSVSDSCGNAYYSINQTVGTSQSVTIFGTGAGIAKACPSGTITVASGSSIFYGFIVLDTSNVGSYGQANINTFGSSTTPTNVATNYATTLTQDNNNIVATFLFFQGGVVNTISANTGTLQASYNGSAAISGGGVITNTSASPANLVTNATISVSAAWTTSTLELRSVQTTVPVIVFPYQATPYYHSNTLNPTNPTVLQGPGGEGAQLCYTGTGHEIDLGPSGLSGANFQLGRYIVDGLSFNCGGSMTNGIFINNWIVMSTISNNQFHNYGNATSWGVWANGNQNDIDMHGNNWVVNDGPTDTLASASNTIPRQWLNVTTNSTAATIRFVNNSAVCISGLLGFTGCNYPAVNTPLLSVSGLTHKFTSNNFMGGFCPVIALGPADYNSEIEGNHFETQTSGCYAITFASTVYGTKIINNYFRLTSTSGIGPRLVGDILQMATVSDNVFNSMPAGVPLVTLNNLANQTGNVARGNLCSTASGILPTPCPIIHTAGGNIAQWNGDNAGTCTMAAGVCPTYTFLANYTVAPKCTASWTGTGLFTGVLQVITTAGPPATLIVKDLVGTDTGVFYWSCNPEAQ